VTGPGGVPLLAVEDLDVAYGDFQVLWQAAMHVGAGEIVALLGPNGAGKSTLMNTVSGLITPRGGRITFQGARIDGLPAHRMVGEGLAHVLERRRLFPFLSVRDNVLLGAHSRAARPHRDATLARVEELWYTSSGGTRVQGWIVKPPAFDPAKRYPLILEIHGGPHAMYNVAFSYQMQNFAANGYVVLYTNPRGSTGYGSTFGNAIERAYPSVDYDDLMAGQIAHAVDERGQGDLAALLHAGDTWTIE